MRRLRLPAVEPGRERRALRRVVYAGALAASLVWLVAAGLHPDRVPLPAWLAAPAAPAVGIGAAATALLVVEARASETVAQALLLVILAALGAAGGDSLRGEQAAGAAAALLALAAVALHPAGAGALAALVALAPFAARSLDQAFEPLVAVPYSLIPVSGAVLVEWLTIRLRRGARQLLSLQAAQSRMVDTIGHEIRTPLTEIKVLMDLLVRVLPLGLPVEQLQRMTPMLCDMRRHCDQLAGVVERAQWYQRLATQRVALSTAETDVAGLLRELTGELAGRARARRIRLDLTAPHSLVAPANARALRRAVESVLDNALKYTPEGGHARVGCAPRHGCAEIWVDDDGPGIRPEDLPYVCEPFFHREYVIDANDSQRGIGLGLSIARQIVEAHGGELRIESAPGSGTCVRLSIPLGAPRAGLREPAGALLGSERPR